MSLFYERQETADSVTITLKPHSLYLMLVMLAVWLGNDFLLKSASMAQIIMPIFIVFMVIRFFSLVRVQREVLVAMKQGRVTTQGSKFSFTNPFRYVIQKAQSSDS
ncbi:hypothetical protein KCG43_17305 [Photobacterium sp. WH24]|uniref:DUF304 domain-containing protein n=1 Tax=Photobacterium arenosum TaxID=2774143 RepID=A0ABR9BR25_9GAMM|nr:MULTISPECIES: hypothetical protein [Photobacterium]MBD8514947.1 hypothetical protein [Photobacterium arenosum]MBV7263767.1 hypothetical protein [Photobacterium sp. WH24]